MGNGHLRALRASMRIRALTTCPHKATGALSPELMHMGKTAWLHMERNCESMHLVTCAARFCAQTILSYSRMVVPGICREQLSPSDARRNATFAPAGAPHLPAATAACCAKLGLFVGPSAAPQDALAKQEISLADCLGRRHAFGSGSGSKASKSSRTIFSSKLKAAKACN